MCHLKNSPLTAGGVHIQLQEPVWCGSHLQPGQAAGQGGGQLTLEGQGRSFLSSDKSSLTELSPTNGPQGAEPWMIFLQTLDP
jgi:hypothetical protein